MDERGKICEGPERQWNHASIPGSVGSGIDFEGNQISDVADTLEKLPWKPEEKDKDRKDGAIRDTVVVFEEI